MEPVVAPDTLPRVRMMAVLAADAVGYSRLMSLDDMGTVAALDAARAVFGTEIAGHAGRVIDMAGDSILAVFDNATAAVQAALAIQHRLREVAASDVPDDRRMHFRIGVHLGDVIEKADGTVYVDGVNIAARLESLASPGTIAVSESVRSTVRGRLEASFEDQGAQQVKNIADPVRAWLVTGVEDTWRQQLAAAAKLETKPTAKDLPQFKKPSIAVLPFINMSADSQQDYFIDGIAEDLTTDLARMQWLFVVASSSTIQYKGVVPDVKKVGRELGVRYLLDGSVRRNNNRLRINARLVDATSGTQLWAERYDRDVADLFDLQDEIGRLICVSVGLSVPDAELARVRQTRPGNLTAWDRYLLALSALRETTKDGFHRAITLLSEAIALEPDFATAHARMAHAYVRAAHFGWAGSGQVAIDEARAHARTGLALDPRNAFALDAMASTHLYMGELDAAAGAAKSALAIDPSISAAYGTLANALAFAGKADEAIAVYEECRQLSPRDPDRTGVLMGFANALFVAARYEDAIEAARKHREMHPNWYFSFARRMLCPSWPP
jgi:adenylate cyclase